MIYAKLLTSFRRGNWLVASWHLMSLISFLAEGMSSKPVNQSSNRSLNWLFLRHKNACLLLLGIYRMIATTSNPIHHSYHSVGFYRLVGHIFPEISVVAFNFLVKSHLKIHLCKISGDSSGVGSEPEQMIKELSWSLGPTISATFTEIGVLVRAPASETTRSFVVVLSFRTQWWSRW